MLRLLAADFVSALRSHLLLADFACALRGFLLAHRSCAIRIFLLLLSHDLLTLLKRLLTASVLLLTGCGVGLLVRLRWSLDALLRGALFVLLLLLRLPILQFAGSLSSLLLLAGDGRTAGIFFLLRGGLLLLLLALNPDRLSLGRPRTFIRHGHLRWTRWGRGWRPRMLGDGR